MKKKPLDILYNSKEMQIFGLSCEEFKDRAFSTVQFSADISHVKIV